MQQSPKLYIDNWGKIYRNATFKKASLYIEFLNKSISHRKSLLGKLDQCSDLKCVNQYSGQLSQEERKYQSFQKSLNQITKKAENQVLLCVDLHVHNDILFCQNEARENMFRKMKQEYERYIL